MLLRRVAIACTRSSFTRTSFNDFDLSGYRGVQTKAREPKLAGLKNNAGSDLLSHTVSHAVPSAVSGLTSVFGMGTGVTLIL